MIKACKPNLHRLLLIAMTSSLCACMSFMPARQPAKPVVTNITIENESILVYLANILAASTEVQKKEVLQLNQALLVQIPPAQTALTESQRSNNKASTSLTPESSQEHLANHQRQASQQAQLPRIRLAGLYGMPNSRVRDPGKAQSLLDELLRDPALSNENRVFVGLLSDYLMDTAKLNVKLREEQKRADSMQLKSENWQSKLEAAQGKVESAQQKADSLQRKLDELKNIEKTMLDRSKATR